MLEKTSVKTWKIPQLPSIPCPVAFHSKEKGGLAAHPPCCHPRRMFGCQENAKKMREKEEKEEKRETGGLASKVYFLDKKKKSPSQCLQMA